VLHPAQDQASRREGDCKLRITRTQVGIVGAGPAGLLLSHLLARAGIDSVVLERASRAHVEGRIRAGVLEHGSVALLRQAGVAARLDAAGLAHGGFAIHFGAERLRIDLAALTGRRVTVYGQHEVVRDLIAAGAAPIVFDAADVTPAGFEGDASTLSWRDAAGTHTLRCDVIAGCDGFHGVCRTAIAPHLTVYDRLYPFAWLGVLVAAPPPSPELIYARAEEGFALASMRAPRVSRMYVQCAPDDALDAWPDARIFDALEARLGVPVARGAVAQRGITAMRSFVAEPMRRGRLFLAGDAAHIVPPTGAKGMNLALADIAVLARALVAHFNEGSDALLDAYSATCLSRIWKVQRFSWWMTALLHRFPDASAFDRRRQLAELEYLAESRAAQTALAENYVGLNLSA
jgi:p-hydroxybenzoate 3-monooxygenase